MNKVSNLEEEEDKEEDEEEEEGKRRRRRRRKKWRSIKFNSVFSNFSLLKSWFKLYQSLLLPKLVKD